MAKIRVTLTRTQTATVEIEVMDAVLSSAVQSAKKSNPYTMAESHPELTWAGNQIKITEVEPC